MRGCTGAMRRLGGRRARAHRAQCLCCTVTVCAPSHNPQRTVLGQGALVLFAPPSCRMVAAHWAGPVLR